MDKINNLSDRGQMEKKADNLMSQGNTNEAKDIYLKLLEDEPENIGILLKVPSAIYWSDNWDFGDENTELMFSFAERAVALEPDNAETHYKLGFILEIYQMGEQSYLYRAAKEYERAVELDNTHPGAVAGVLRLQKSTRFTVDEAIDLIKKAIATCDDRPAKSLLFNQLGSYYQQEMKDEEKALEAYRSAVDYWDGDKEDIGNNFSPIPDDTPVVEEINLVGLIDLVFWSFGLFGHLICLVHLVYLIFLVNWD